MISASILLAESNDPVEEESGVTQPCHPNPCEEGHLCIVSRRKCDANEKCPHHRCLPGMFELGKYFLDF